MTPPTATTNEAPASQGQTLAVATRGERVPERTIFEKTTPGSRAMVLPALDVEETPIPESLATPGTNWPELSQLQVIRHYHHLSQRNFSIDGEFYPLGSCTMKYNPRINEWAAARPGLASLHPHQQDADIQGALELLYKTRRLLEEISGLDEASLQPAAGAHGEYTALKVMRAYFADKGENRTVVFAPDTAHGTNPASCAMCGAGAVNVRTVDGYTDIGHLKELIAEHGAENVVGLMITNPNTAGLFDSKIIETADIIHEAGGLIYLDGANMNAILGKALPGEFGVDVMHYNVHKTFSTPHGCGGPGGGPIVVRDFLAPFLPKPQIVHHADEDRYGLTWDMPKSIGKVRSFITQFGIMVRCWTYISACGPDGLRNIAETSVLNANYLASRLRHRYEMPYFRPEAGSYAAHEFVTIPTSLLEKGVKLDDIAKRLIDYGIHPPTMHWPVINCLMVEPTETEPKNVLDRFADVMLKIADEIEQETDLLHNAPHPTDAPLSRIDVVSSDRKPKLTSDI